jgi:succinate dehydrogenase/fumarate reductase-like Fe-S protein
MPNNQLQNKTYTVPDKVFNRINQMLKQIKVSDDQTKGFKRAKDIVSDRQVSYSQMNRLKNYFDN